MFRTQSDVPVMSDLDSDVDGGIETTSSTSTER